MCSRRHAAHALLLVVTALVSIPAAAHGQHPGHTSPPGPVLLRPGLVPEPQFIARSIDLANRTVKIGDGVEQRNGLYPELGKMVRGAGWVSAGPGYRHWFPNDSVYVEASMAVSWRLFKMAEVRVELPRLASDRLTIGSQIRWQDLTQLAYFGEGPDSSVDDRSEYSARTTNLVAYAAYRPARTIAIHARAGGLSHGQLVPFYLMPTLGGDQTLRSYSNYRFSDRSIATLAVESRIALFTHVDVALFVDAGGVAPGVLDLSLDKRSYGVGLRRHSGLSTFARLDIARGGEGWRAAFRLTGPLPLKTVSQQTAALPF